MEMVAYFQFNQKTAKNTMKVKESHHCYLAPKILCISTKYKGVPLSSQMSKEKK